MCKLLHFRHVILMPYDKNRRFVVQLETVDKTGVAEDKDVNCNATEEYNEDECLFNCLAKKYIKKFNCIHARYE